MDETRFGVPELIVVVGFLVGVAALITAASSRLKPGEGSMTFRHPLNNYTVTPGIPFLWCLLFGPLYFIKHGAWGQALIVFVVAVGTMGFAWFVLPFFAKGMIRTAYLSKGWIEVSLAAPVVA